MRTSRQYPCVFAIMLLLTVIGTLCAPSRTRASVVTLAHTPASGTAGARSDHTFSFTPGNSIPPSGIIQINFGNGFTREDTDMDVTDVDLLVNATQQTLSASADFTANGVTVADTVLLITLNSTVGIEANSSIEIRVGTNTTEGGTGNRQYQNPATGGSKTITMTTYNTAPTQLDSGSVTMSITATQTTRRVNPPPAPPTNISATAQAQSVQITWTDPKDSDFSHIELYRDHFPIPTTITADLFGTIQRSIQSFTDTTAQPGITYRYLLKTVDTAGNANDADVISVTVPLPPPPPPPPPPVTIVPPVPSVTVPIVTPTDQTPPPTPVPIDFQVGPVTAPTDTIAIDFGGITLAPPTPGCKPTPMDPEQKKRIDEMIQRIDEVLKKLNISLNATSGSADANATALNNNAARHVQTLHQAAQTVECANNPERTISALSSALTPAQRVLDDYARWQHQNVALTRLRQTSPNAARVFLQDEIRSGRRVIAPRFVQRFLNTHGFPVARFGAGSPGSETNALGPRTRSALENFQRSYGLPATGILDAPTRDLILTVDPYDADITCDAQGYTAQKGGGDKNTDHAQFPPKKTYDYKRFGLEVIAQDPYGSKTCFPTTAAMSFGWLDRQYNTNLVPKKEANLPDPSKSIEELKKRMDWNAEDGSNSASAVSGIASFIRDHGGADTYEIEFYTEAPRNKGFKYHDEMEGQSEVSGVKTKMKRKRITGRDVYDEMAKGQDVIIGIKGHVLEMYGMNLDDAEGNYDAAWADPAFGKIVGGKITASGKIEVGGLQTDIQDIIAVSPKKK
ncbi:peptidoglycan-binding protein [Candidatus Uhrbacteria bacterium]|nr:peptidoglycan-binding protein [Candidatus Uhrbacteria bacterium]